jgi:hypothetical protein
VSLNFFLFIIKFFVMIKTFNRSLMGGYKHLYISSIIE